MGQRSGLGMKKILAVALSVMIILCGVMGGCLKEKEKEWWEDRSLLTVQITAFDGEPLSKEYIMTNEPSDDFIFTYRYVADRQSECVPNVKVIDKDGNQRGYVVLEGKRFFVLWKDEYVYTGAKIIEKGKYKVIYHVYKNEKETNINDIVDSIWLEIHVE